MAANKRPKPLLPWLQHHKLIATEALLVAGIIQQLLSSLVSGSTLPGAAKVLLTMASVAGLLSLVAVTAQTIARLGLSGTHRWWSRALPLPQLLLHGLLFAGLFCAYAVIWRIRVALPFIGPIG